MSRWRGLTKYAKLERSIVEDLAAVAGATYCECLVYLLNLIANTTNSAGLKVREELGKNVYETGKKITDKQKNSLNIVKDDVLPGWNYILIPNNEIEKKE
ncbi:MAG: hypothetical protein H6618_09575 [Deltaproteobacteria bacterium]|nr:hypothetical protein [Deltaproteobacteria bacterium]